MSHFGLFYSIIEHFDKCFLKEIGVSKHFAIRKSEIIVKIGKCCIKRHLGTHFFKSFVEWQNSLNKVILICRRRCYKLTKLACRASVHYFEGSSQFYGEGPFKKMTQEVVKVTGSCRLFCAFSICDSLERHNAAKTRRYACCPCLLPS